LQSSVVKVTYTIKDKPAPPADPIFSLPAGRYAGSQTVTISCSTSGAEIYYTLDGTDPNSSSKHYSGALTVDKTTRITAVAIKDKQSSAAVAVNYEIYKKPGDDSWQDWVFTEPVAPLKVFTISLNKAVDPTTVSTSTVYFTDEEGNHLGTSLTLGKDGKSIQVKAKSSRLFVSGKTYFLFIDQGLKSLPASSESSGQNLKSKIRMEFTIK
jgi:hypothetical protein